MRGFNYILNLDLTVVAFLVKEVSKLFEPACVWWQKLLKFAQAGDSVNE